MSTKHTTQVEYLEARTLYIAGDVDTQFGVGGLATSDFPASAIDVGVGVGLQGGRTVVAGFSLGTGGKLSPALARFTVSGALDSTFGTGGRAQPQFGDDVTFIPAAVTVLEGGQILLAGTIDNAAPGDDNAFGIARLNANGTPDTGFGNAGLATAEFANAAVIVEGIAVDASGNILVGGTVFTQDASALAIARFSPAGVLDNSFDGDGRLAISIPNAGSAQGHAIAVAPDGDIVIVGEANVLEANADETRFAVARVNPSGTPDDAFGDQGVALVDFGTEFGIARAVSVQGDNRVVVAGSAFGPGNSNFAVARLLTSGTPDPNFGNAGLVQTDFGVNDTAYAVKIQTNGAIVVAGRAESIGSNDRFGVARYTPAGTPDPGFAFLGKTTINVTPGGDNEARGIALQDNGNIVLGGMAEDGSNDNLAVVRLNAAGFVDPAFNGNGTAQADFFTPGAFDVAESVALQSDGKIIAGGLSVGLTGNEQFALARYGTSGTPDPTFGTAGIVLTGIPGFHDAQLVDLAVDDLDRIVAVGTAIDNANDNEDFVVVRFTAAGAIDTAFGGGDGIVTVDGTKEPQSSHDDFASDVLVQPDGKILIAGRTDFGGNGENFMLVRLTDTGDFDPAFGISGGIVVTNIEGGSDDDARAITLDDQNRILAAGTTNLTGSGKFALVRYSPNGFVDPNFGVGGRATDDLGFSAALASDVAVQQGGGIVVAGTALNGPEDGVFGLVRFDDAGQLDTSFGVGGRATTSFGAGTLAFSKTLIVQDDDKLIVTGAGGGEGRLAAARYTPGGLPDNTFGTAGKRLTPFTDPPLGGSGASVIQDDGRVVVVGAADDPEDDVLADFAVVRLQADAPQQQQPTVTSLTLINALTDQPIMTLVTGVVLDLAALPSQLNVRADVGAAPAAGSVRFGLDANASFQTESAAPFALFGNTGNDYKPGTFAAGAHTLTATPFTGTGATGTAGVALTIQFQVVAAPVPVPAALTFTLVNADTDQDIMPLTEGTVLNLATLPPKVNVRANSASAIGSVRFGLDNNANFKVESAQPYSLFGDAGGNYAAGAFSAGQHTLTATPFSGSGATGVAGASSTVHFQVVNQPLVTTLVLINAQTDQPIMTLTNGAVLDLSMLGTSQFNVRADTAPGTVGSVRFNLDNTLFQTENTKPYALFGNAGNDYNAGGFTLGNHTLSVTAYSQSNASGIAGPVKTVAFTVVT